MVCIYCGAPTQVINSRPQKQSNTIWRRRKCRACQAVFSSKEHFVYEAALRVNSRTSHIVAFSRDLLFLSIYDACKHREKAVADASAITETITGKLLASHTTSALIDWSIIVKISSQCLSQFDTAAYTHYLAFHPS